MSSRGSVQLYQAAVSGVGWKGLLTDAHIRKNINKSQGLPGRRTGLHMACVRGSVELVEHLLQMEADPNFPDKRGDSALHKAAFSGHPKCVRSLLSHGAKIDLKNSRGETALHKAVTTGQAECVEVLLQNEASVNARNGFGDLPLHLASQGTNLDCLRLLLSHSQAAINLRNTRGQTPMDLAIENQDPPITLMLSRYGARTQHHVETKEEMPVLAVKQGPAVKQGVPTGVQRAGTDDSVTMSNLDKTSWPLLPGQKGPIPGNVPPPHQPVQQRSNGTRNPELELPDGRKAKNLKVQAYGREHYFERTAAFNGGSITVPPMPKTKVGCNVGDLGSQSVLELGTSGDAVIQFGTDNPQTISCQNTDILNELITSDNSLLHNADNTPHRGVESKSSKAGHLKTTTVQVGKFTGQAETSPLQIGKLTKQAEVNFLQANQLTEQAEANPTQAGKLTKFSWSDVGVEMMVPRLGRDITIQYQQQGGVPLGDWEVVSGVYSLRPHNIHSYQPLLLSFPVRSSKSQLDLVCSSKNQFDIVCSSSDPASHCWTPVTRQKEVQLAWTFIGDRCYIYLWQLCSLCVVKQLDVGAKQQQKAKNPILPEQQQTQKAASTAAIGEVCELTRQIQDMDIFSAALKNLTTGLGQGVSEPAGSSSDDQCVEIGGVKSETVQSDTDQKVDTIQALQSETDPREVATESPETDPTKGQTEASPDENSSTVVTSDLQTGGGDQQNPNKPFLLYLYPPKGHAIPEDAKVATYEKVSSDSDLEFIQYVQKHTSQQVLGMVRQTLEKLGVKSSEGDVETGSLLRLWLVSKVSDNRHHHGNNKQLSSKEIWKPLAEGLQHLGTDVAEEFILSYEFYHLQRQRSAIESSITEEEAQAVCQHLYMAMCLSERLKKQLKKQENAKKLAFLLEKYVLQSREAGGSKAMSDFKKALYHTRPDLVQMFSLL